MKKKFKTISDTEFALRKKRLGSVMPKEEDLHGSARALIRLQEIYELDITNLAKGQMNYNGRTFNTMAKLSAQVHSINYIDKKTQSQEHSLPLICILCISIPWFSIKTYEGCIWRVK